MLCPATRPRPPAFVHAVFLAVALGVSQAAPPTLEANVSNIVQNRQPVQVSIQGVERPTAADVVALYLSGHPDLHSSVPLKYKWLTDADSYLKTGSAEIRYCHFPQISSSCNSSLPCHQEISLCEACIGIGGCLAILLAMCFGFQPQHWLVAGIAEMSAVFAAHGKVATFGTIRQLLVILHEHVCNFGTCQVTDTSSI